MRGLNRLIAPVRIATIAALYCGSTAVFAQVQGAQGGGGTAGGGLEEVVVTAQFREENVQNTPLAITAVSAETLAARGQTSITDIAQHAPSVVLSPTTGAFGPSMAAYIRGIGQSDLDPALEPGVGIYIDDVYFGTLTGSLLDLLDLDRVEVLRGPQGTLEGMNSEGGAIKLFSKKPDSKESIGISVLGGSRNHFELRGMTNFAIGDNLFVRLTGVGNHQDGYVTRYDFGCSNPAFTATDINGVTGTYSVAPAFSGHINPCVLGQEGGIGYAAGRMAVRWVPTDALEFNLIADLSNQSQDAPAETLIYAGPGPNTYPSPNASAANVSAPGLAIQTTSGNLLPYDVSKVPALLPSNFYTSYANFCLPAATTAVPGFLQGLFGPGVKDPAWCVNPKQAISNWGAQLAADWKINDALALRNIVSLRGFASNWVHDNDVSIWNGDLGAEAMGHHQLSEELRLNGTWNKRLDYTVGGFYFQERTVYFGHEDLWYAVSGFPGVFNFYQNDPVDAHDRAAFVHLTYHAAEKLNLTFGTRYTSQDKTYHYVRLDPEGQPGGSATLVAPLNGASSHYQATRWDWRADIDYHITDQVMSYLQYSTGFKGGGVDPRPFYVAQAVQFAPESLKTYELGFKTSWFDNHLRANIDAYYSKYNDIQLTLSNCSNVPAILAASQAAGFNFGSPCALPYNAGAAHQKGVEFESQVRIGGFQADTNISWLKFQYDSLDPNSGVTLNMVTPYTPKWTGTLGVQYTLPIESRGSVTARIDGTSRSNVQSAAINDAYTNIPGYTLYNAHVSWESSKANWQVIARAKNLAGKHYFQNIFDLVDAGQGTVSGNPGPPLEVDLEIKHEM